MISSSCTFADNRRRRGLSPKEALLGIGTDGYTCTCLAPQSCLLHPLPSLCEFRAITVLRASLKRQLLMTQAPKSTSLRSLGCRGRPILQPGRHRCLDATRKPPQRRARAKQTRRQISRLFRDKAYPDVKQPGGSRGSDCGP